VPDEQTEGLEPRRLRKRGKTGESRFYFHKSRYIEINDGAMTFLMGAPALLRARSSVTQAYCQEHFA
jgi:hypothetical protein